MADKIINCLKNICLVQFTALFYAIGCGILNGAQVEKTLIIDKLCRFEFNFTEGICNNLTFHERENKEVQKRWCYGTV